MICVRLSRAKQLLSFRAVLPVEINLFFTVHVFPLKKWLQEKE